VLLAVLLVAIPLLLLAALIRLIGLGSA